MVSYGLIWFDCVLGWRLKFKRMLCHAVLLARTTRCPADWGERRQIVWDPLFRLVVAAQGYLNILEWRNVYQFALDAGHSNLEISDRNRVDWHFASGSRPVESMQMFSCWCVSCGCEIQWCAASILDILDGVWCLMVHDSDVVCCTYMRGCHSRNRNIGGKLWKISCLDSVLFQEPGFVVPSLRMLLELQVSEVFLCQAKLRSPKRFLGRPQASFFVISVVHLCAFGILWGTVSDACCLFPKSSEAVECHFLTGDPAATGEAASGQRPTEL